MNTQSDSRTCVLQLVERFTVTGSQAQSKLECPPQTKRPFAEGRVGNSRYTQLLGNDPAVTAWLLTPGPSVGSLLSRDLAGTLLSV